TRLADAVETNVATGGYALGALVLVQALLMLTLGRRRVWGLIADPPPVAPRPREPWVGCEICHAVLAAAATAAPPAERLPPRPAHGEARLARLVPPYDPPAFGSVAARANEALSIHRFCRSLVQHRRLYGVDPSRLAAIRVLDHRRSGGRGRQLCRGRGIDDAGDRRLRP